MSEQQTTEFGKLIKRLDELESTVARQDKLHKVLVERHDNLVRKTHAEEPDHSFLDDETIMYIEPMVNPSRAAGMTMSGDLDLPPFQREVFDRLHRLEIHNALEGEQKVTFTGHLESLEETVDEHYRINQARVDNINDRVVELENTIENNISSRLDYHRDRLDKLEKAGERYDVFESRIRVAEDYITSHVPGIFQRLSIIEDYDLKDIEKEVNRLIPNRLSAVETAYNNGLGSYEHDLRELFERLFQVEGYTGDMQQQLDIAKNLNEQKFFSVHEYIDRFVGEIGDEIKDLHESVHINSKAIDDGKTVKGTVDSHGSVFIPADTYYGRLAFNLSGGCREVENTILLALRGMREEDVQVLIAHVAQHLIANRSSDGLITE